MRYKRMDYIMATYSESYDAIVAGAGLGGLMAAAKLSKAGKRVLVLERHSIPGGYASFFKRKGFRFEASLHALDGMFGDDIKNRAIFTEFGLDKSLNFIRLHEFFRVLGPDGLDVTVPDTLDGAKAAYLSACPDEKENIDRFFELSRKIYDQVMGIRSTKLKDLLNLPKFIKNNRELFKNFRGNLGDYMKMFSDNHKLKMLIAANASYYHDNPNDYSLIHFMAAQSSYFRGGAAQVTGGSYEMAVQLVKIIEANGGEIRLGAEVTSVELTKGKVSGVKYRPAKAGHEEIIGAPIVVGNLPFPKLTEMLPPAIGAKLMKPYRNYTKSPSIFQVYFGLKQPLTSIGIDNYSSIIFPDGYTDFTTMKSHNYAKNYGERILFLNNYSALDLFPGEGNKPTACATVLDLMPEWEQLSEEAYVAKKEVHCEEIMASMEKRFPGFRDCVEYVSIASPKTFERYTNNPGGSVYGYAQDVRQLGPQRPRNKTKVKGLYLASAWSFPGGGMIPALKSGYYAAQEILKHS